MSDDRAREWLLWARSQRIAIVKIKVGDVELDIAADLMLTPNAPSLVNDRPEQDPYEIYGGAALQRLRNQESSEPRGDSLVVEDD